MSEIMLQNLQKKIIQLEKEATNIKMEYELFDLQKNTQSENTNSKTFNEKNPDVVNVASSTPINYFDFEKEKKVIMIGVVGSQPHIGVTHTSITIANLLKRNNHKVALAEFNASGAFDTIKNEFVSSSSNKSNTSFEYQGLNFYSKSNMIILDEIFMKDYEFIIIDFGDFNSNFFKNLFLRCDIKIIVAGSKPWEMQALDNIFLSINFDQLENYHYCFNFSTQNMLTRIQSGMESLHNIYFLEYNSDPFNSSSKNIEPILKEYITADEPKKKKFLFNRRNVI